MDHEIVIHCPNKNCGALFAKEVLLKPGSHFKGKCTKCGEVIYVNYTTRGGLQVY